VTTPILHLNTRIVKAHEPGGVQTLGSALAIETLDVADICRPAGREKSSTTLLW